MQVENKFPDRNVTAEYLQTKFPLAAKGEPDHKTIISVAGWNSEGL